MSHAEGEGPQPERHHRVYVQGVVDLVVYGLELREGEGEVVISRLELELDEAVRRVRVDALAPAGLKVIDAVAAPRLEDMHCEVVVLALLPMCGTRPALRMS